VSEHSPIVRIELSSRPECLTLLRSVVAGVGELLSLDAELIVDLKMAVSEAAGNAVLHAYRGAPGPLAVELRIRELDVEIRVRDRGTGIQTASQSPDRMGVGLAVITALADRAEFLTLAEGGTEVRMSFAVRRLDGAPLTVGPSADDAHLPLRLDGEVIVTLAPLELLGAVLGRVCRALAARAHFSVDRFSDIHLVADALALHASTYARLPTIGFSVGVESRRLEVLVGPFAARGAQALQDPGGASALPRLVEDLTLVPGPGWEMVRFVIADHRGIDR
jgi:anti-sigma regulatory factor (Ser/Thr protein kinase)